MKLLSSDKVNTNVILSLFYFNLKWHYRVMTDTILEYKILVLFIILLIAPTLTTLIHLIAFPAQAIFKHSDTKTTSILFSLFLYQFFALIWIFIHQLVMLKQPWKKYLLSLHISNIEKMITDILTLLFIDLILWIPLLFSAMGEIFEAHHTTIIDTLITCKSILLIEIILFIQIAWIKSKYKLIALTALIDILLAIGIKHSESTLQTTLIAFLILITYILINYCYKNVSIKFSIIFSSAKNIISNGNYHESFPLIRIKIKNLIANSAQLSVLLLSMSLMTMVSIFLMIYGKNNSLLPSLISTIMLLNALSGSNLFKRMHNQWEQFSAYLFSIPITKIDLFKINFIITSTIVLFFNLSIVLIFSFIEKNHVDFKIAVSLLMSIIFLIFTYAPQIKLKRYGIFVSFFLMSLFLYIDHLLIQ